MFYVRLKLQKWREHCIARGPNFGSAQQKNIWVDGTEICITVPRNRAKRKTLGLIEPQKGYRFSDPKDREARLSVDMHGWNTKALLARQWDFFGPWFVGELALVRCVVRVIQNEKPEGTSYFHPRVMENAILERMAAKYSEISYSGDQMWYVPRKWKPLQNYACPAVTFLAESNKEKRPTDDNQHYVIFPIHNDYLVEVQLKVYRDPMWVNGERDDDLEKWLPIAPMETLIQQVMNSIEVKLSPEAKAQMEEAQKGLEDVSLVKEFPPIDMLEYQRNQESRKE